MQYLYRKYGRDRAALAATLITYRPKSAMRDVGKALGLDLAQVDRLAGVFAWWDGRVIQRERIREAGFDPDSPTIRRLIKLSSDLMGFPRHLSQHVGGFVITRASLERMVPVENAAMEDRTVIQWDKDDLDAMGLLKVDCLALGMLSAIRRALQMIGDVGPRCGCRTSRRGSRGLRDDPACRHDRRLPDRVARADVDAAAAAAAQLLRPGHRGRDRPPRPDPGRHGASLPAAASGPGACDLSERRGEGGARAHARRADLPGAGDAARDRRRRVHARRGRPFATRDGGVAAQRRPRGVRAAADRRHDRARAKRRRSRGRSSSRSTASASTASPNRMRRASRCSSMCRAG